MRAKAAQTDPNEPTYDWLRRQRAAYQLWVGRDIAKEPTAAGHWLWQRKLNSKGYAYVRVDGHDYLVVRILYEDDHGEPVRQPPPTM